MVSCSDKATSEMCDVFMVVQYLWCGKGGKCMNVRLRSPFGKC